MDTCNALNMRGFLQKFSPIKLLMTHCTVATDLLYSLQAKRNPWYFFSEHWFYFFFLYIISVASDIFKYTEKLGSVDSLVFCSWTLQYGSHLMALTERSIIPGETMLK